MVGWYGVARCCGNYGLMNPAVILALIVDLYGQIIVLQEQNAALQKQATS